MRVRARRHWLFAGLLVGGACESSGLVKGVENQPPPQGECLVKGASGDLVFRDCIGLSPATRIDLLFVIDDGPNAAGLQARLADALPGFLSALDGIEPKIDLRIGITTAHDGTPGCEPGPGSGGRLWLQSCREHPDDFVDAQGLDGFESHCAQRCGLERLDVEPTATAVDPTLAPRPWLEVGPWHDNLPPGVTLAEALACATALGTSGCPLSAPLASGLRVDRRSSEPGDTIEGFRRYDAAPVFVMVSSGVDCSVTSTGAPAFAPSADRALWSDRAARDPTPAACWNAGVTCEEPDGSGATLCAVRDVGVDGGDADPDDAVLHPIAALAGDYREIGNRAGIVRPNTRASVFALAGVPSGFATGDALPVQAASDPAVAVELGVEPACLVDDGRVVPALRLAAFAEEATSPALHVELASACVDDYGPALARVVESIEELVQPMCMPACVADTDEDEAGLQVDCSITVNAPRSDGSIDDISLPVCELAADGSEVIPDGTVGCWSPRTGDARHPTCAEHGFNLEVTLQWDGPFPHGAVISPYCALSAQKSVDCPDLR